MIGWDPAIELKAFCYFEDSSEAALLLVVVNLQASKRNFARNENHLQTSGPEG